MMKSDDNKSKQGLIPFTDIFFDKDGMLSKEGALIVALASVAIAMAIWHRLFKK